MSPDRRQELIHYLQQPVPRDVWPARRGKIVEVPNRQVYLTRDFQFCVTYGGSLPSHDSFSRSLINALVAEGVLVESYPGAETYELAEVDRNAG